MVDSTRPAKAGASRQREETAMGGEGCWPFTGWYRSPDCPANRLPQREARLRVRPAPCGDWA